MNADTDMTQTPAAPPPALARDEETLYAVLPMRNLVLFPNVLAPVSVGRPKSLAALRHAVDRQQPVVLVLQKAAQDDEPGLADLWEVGTLAQVLQFRMEDDADEGLPHAQALCQGLRRVRIVGLVPRADHMAVQVEPLLEADMPSTRAEAMALQLRERGMEILSLMPGVPRELSQMIQGTRSPSQLADLTASLLDIEPAEKQALLAMVSTEDRLARVLQQVSHRLEVLRLSQEIGARTKEQLDDRQRRVVLEEQLRAIRRELGENGDSTGDLAGLAEAVRDAGMPPEVETQMRKELDRLRRMKDSGGEASALRSWIEWTAGLPWAEPKAATIDLAVARQILAADHFGLARAKQRIVEYLAVKKLNPGGRAPILCFVGPPGVGKTSLGQSVARAISRPFVRVSLGGVHDEAELRGHRRTYVGALPGHILQGLRRAGARDAVLMLDEVDKMSAGLHGDPYAALLEVLDPEQNSTFRDNYLGLPFDLSRVFFLCTANVVDLLPPPVRDRMEIIELPGYTQEEKLQIAHRHLVTRQRQACGLEPSQCELTEAALQALVSGYTREAGVRQFEREIGRVMRIAALRVAEGSAVSVKVDAPDLEALLGPPTVEHDVALRASVPGVATGLAWTPAGGDILFIEASRAPGSGRLILTGQLGEVMKESAQAALTLVKSMSSSLGVPASAFSQVDVHIHIPAGAIPKDGPSAGVALLVALASLFSNRPVRHDIAMTGEISLRGLVLPVGGIKEKVLAAQRAGVRTVLLPARNRKDLAEVPDSTRAALTFTWLDTAAEALESALAAAPSGEAQGQPPERAKE